jgi:hypothetical protein
MILAQIKMINLLNQIFKNTTVALINNQTNFVENIVVIELDRDEPPIGYSFAEIPIIKKFPTKQDEELYNMLREIDPNFVFERMYEGPVDIIFNKTKWTQEKGFFED